MEEALRYALAIFDGRLTVETQPTLEFRHVLNTNNPPLSASSQNNNVPVLHERVKRKQKGNELMNVEEILLRRK